MKLRGIFLLTFLMPFVLLADNICGDWSGLLEISPNNSVKLIFHIGQDDISIDSPDQGALGMEGEFIYHSADSVSFIISEIGLEFSGSINDNILKGVTSQAGYKIPLNMTPGIMRANRPQTPKEPYPYKTEEVTIESKNATLAGTLTYPIKINKKTPIVVMVTGSGLQNRDEEIFEHKPFAVIADFLAQNGIASLRYDDRGFGQSTGDAVSATTADFASDAKAVVEWVNVNKKFGKIGILGHSEGGIIAYMLGRDKDNLNFIVSIAGPVVRGDSILVYQNLHNLKKSGIPQEISKPFGDALAKAFQLKIDLPSAFMTDQILSNIYPQYNDSPLTRQLVQGIRGIFTPGKQSKWMQYFISHSPAQDLKDVEIPAFLIYGEKDTQVPASMNISIAESLLPDAKVKTYTSLNHLMQHAQSGDVEEYKQIEETISLEVLEDIVKFINGLK